MASCMGNNHSSLLSTLLYSIDAYAWFNLATLPKKHPCMVLLLLNRNRCLFTCMKISIVHMMSVYAICNLLLFRQLFLHTKQEPNLCATQYLPDIVKLQHYLFDTYHRQLEKHKAETLTVRDFLKGITNGKERLVCYQILYIAC